MRLMLVRNWRKAALLAAALFAGVLALTQSAQLAEAPRPIAVRAVTIDYFDMSHPDRIRFGELEFRGGLELTSNDIDLGGLSALALSPDGEQFLSVSDKGRWFRGRIVYRNGRMTGIADAHIAPLMGPDGETLASRGWYDAESLAQDGDTLYVGIERVNEIVKFNYGKDGLLARAEPIALPPEVKKLPFNKGIESLAFVPPGQPLSGTLIAISERGLDRAGNVIGFLIGGPSPGSFTVRRIGDFDVSDAALLPGGDLLLLERSYSPAKGVAMRMRRVRQADIKPGAVIDGPVMVEADMGYQIDNMEGLAIHRNAQGETLLTMVSDDNFSPVQRTIVLQFALVSE